MMVFPLHRRRLLQDVWSWNLSVFAGVRSRPGHRIPLLVVGMALLAAIAEGNAEARRFTLDDMMAIQGFGSADFDPKGRWLVYEQLRPYGDVGDYSFRTYAWSKTGHQIWRYDLGKDGVARPLPGLDSKPSSFLQGFSPSGRYIAVMQYQFGDLTLSAYDMEGDTNTAFGPTPAFEKAGNHNPVWISDDEIIYAALPTGERPPMTSVRAHAGDVIPQAWQDAWRGDVVTSTEVRTTLDDRSLIQEAGALVRANAKTGATTVLADGLYADLLLSPDRRHIAALAVSQPRSVNPDAPYEQDLRRYRLSSFDLTTGDETIFAPEIEFMPYSIAWAPDGRRLTAFGWRNGEGPRDGRFYLINVSTGTITRLEHSGLELTSERERGWRQRPERAVFFGDALAVYAREIPGHEDQTPQFSYQDFFARGLSRPDWYALSVDGKARNLTADLEGVSGVPIHAGDNHLTIMAADGIYRFYSSGQTRRLSPVSPGRFRFLAPGTFATPGGVIRPEFPEQAVFEVRGDGPTKIIMISLQNDDHESAIVMEPPAQFAATPLAGSHVASAALFRTEAGAASHLLLTTREDPQPQAPLAVINDHLSDVDLGSWTVVTYQVADHKGEGKTQSIESCVLLPPGYDGSERVPLVVEVYPDVGPSCKNQGRAKITGATPVSPYLWAAQGYAYSRLTTPLELIRTPDGPIAGIHAVIDSGVDALVEEGIVDPDKIVVYGFSQGGAAALYVAANSNRFKATIAMNSWSNFFSHYFGSSGIYSSAYSDLFGLNAGRYDQVKGSEYGIGRTPFEDPDVYLRNSPVFLAPNINTPVLLIHSDMDSFPASQFDEMYGALQRAGKDARYVLYRGEGHAPSSPANIRDLRRRIEEFLEGLDLNP